MATVQRLEPADAAFGVPAPSISPRANHAPGPAPALGWPRAVLAWVAVLIALGALLHADVAHMLTRWWNSSTYGHCLLIPPIIGWLVWQRRDALARIAPRPWWPGAVLMFGAGAMWLVGELAGVALLRHAALVGLFMASVPTVLGLSVARACAFPLFFALFMIPTGEQLEPTLQRVTAWFCMKLLALFGVPAFNDGVFITIPNGDFEVAEACSGVRFLIAMIAFGALVSNVCFLSARRRVAFMAAAVILPIVANGVRAWGTIYIAHLTTPDFARGVDHIVYGWIFFAVVMALLLAVGWRYFDRPVDDPFVIPERVQRPGTPPATGPALAAVAALALGAGALAPAWGKTVEARAVAQPTRAVVLDAPPGWRATAYRARTEWRPAQKSPSGEAFATFEDAVGPPVEVYVAVYDRQYEGHELVGWGQGARKPMDEGGWQWAQNAADPVGGHGFQMKLGGSARDIVQYYRVNGELTGSETRAKVLGLLARLTGDDPQAAVLFVSAERIDDLTSARPAIDRFLAASGPPGAVMDRAIRR